MSNQKAIIVEAVSFLRDRNPNAKRAASEQIAGLAGHPEGVKLLKLAPDLVINLARLIGDSDATSSRNSLKALINLCVEDEGLLAKAIQTNVVRRTLDMLLETFKITSEDAILCIQLLSNVTLKEDGVKKFLLLDDSNMKGYYLKKMVGLLNKDTLTKPEDTDAYAWVGSILNNCTQLKEGRELIVDKTKGIIVPLLPHIRSPSVTRRRGVIATIKNCLFDKEFHHYLMGKDVDIITHLLYPLRGPELLDADDIDGMDPTLLDQKTRETDQECLQMLLEALLLLTAEKSGRHLLKKKKAYPIVRDYEKVEQNETISDAIYKLVHVLLLDEPEQAAKHEAEMQRASRLITAGVEDESQLPPGHAAAASAAPEPEPKVEEKPVKKVELDEKGEEIEEI